jgi:ATP-dependent Zn protease
MKRHSFEIVLLISLFTITNRVSIVSSETRRSLFNETIKPKPSVLLTEVAKDEIEYQNALKESNIHFDNLDKPIAIESTDKSPDSIKQSKNKQSENASPASTTANINTFSIVVPIIVVILFVIMGVTFIILKRKAVLQRTRRPVENNSRARSGPIYSPIVVQRENVELNEI